MRTDAVIQTEHGERYRTLTANLSGEVTTDDPRDSHGLGQRSGKGGGGLRALLRLIRGD